MCVRQLVFCGLLLCTVASLAAATGDRASAPDFERDVAPILIRRCLECHSAAEASGALVLTTRQGALEGGDSGPALLPADPSRSPLLERVSSGEMPPEKKNEPQPLPASEVETLRRWIAAGAPWPEGRTLDLFEQTSESRGGRDWWSLQPVREVAVPADASIAHPVDRFIGRKLAAAGMRPAPPADRRTLIRRLYYDLIGLPPTFQQIEAFENDSSRQAWENLVDQLLESPHYGERWARYWLDVVRFAETCGYERDQEKRFAWKYRDWVVQALNTDMPYDRFILEQVAGDELPDRSEQTLIATGFLRLGTWNDEPNDPQDYKYERLEDMVHTTSSAMLGLTVKCARCHEHKFDPIRQVDYYRMAAAFWAGPIEPRDRKYHGGPSAEELGMQEVLGWTDLGPTPPPLHLLKAGERSQPQQVVDSGPLSFVPVLFQPFHPPTAGSPTSGRRLQLAHWIASPKNPLTARVLVNRLWQHHLGKGLVRTPNNFGFRGEQPTHPQLLDWLAHELVRGGWKIKRLHRLILTSDTYRQSSLHPQQSAYSQTDLDNRLCWRAQRRRLDAESLRDSMLWATREIDLRRGGPGFQPTIVPEVLASLSDKTAAWRASPPEAQLRRSLYLYTKRGLILPLMTTFDFCDTTLPCGQRNVTTVAPQALALLNSDFTHARSTALARQVISASGHDPPSAITQAWTMALGRTPADQEAAAALAHVTQQRKRFQELLQSGASASLQRVATDLEVRRELALHLRADGGIRGDAGGRIGNWSDQSGSKHSANQPAGPEFRPVLIHDAIHGRPAIHFDGQRRYMQLTGQVITSRQFTVLAVVNDHGAHGERQILSNFSAEHHQSVTAAFLGLDAAKTIRFTDHLSVASNALQAGQPFLLTAINGKYGAVVYHNDTPLVSQEAPLELGQLDTPWVIGRQGDVDGQYWHGDMAEIIVYDRELPTAELHEVWRYLSHRYQLPLSITAGREPPPNPDLLAWASLCHVLFNSNEFIYVD